MYSKMQKKAAAAVKHQVGASWRVTLQEIERGVEYDLTYFSFSFVSCRWVEQFTQTVRAATRRSLAYKIGDLLAKSFRELLKEEFPEDVALLRRRAARSVGGLKPFNFNVDLSQVIWQVRNLQVADLVPQVVGGVKIELRETAQRVSEAFSYVLRHQMLRWSIKKIDSGFESRMSTWLRSQVERKERELLRKRQRASAYQKRRSTIGRQAAEHRQEVQQQARQRFAARMQERLQKKEQKKARRQEKVRERDSSPRVPLSRQARELLYEKYNALLTELRERRCPKCRHFVWPRSDVLRKPVSSFWRRIVVLQAHWRRRVLVRRLLALNALVNLSVLSYMSKYSFDANRAIGWRPQSQCNRRRRERRATSRLASRLCYIPPDFQVLPPLIEHQAGEEDPLNMDPVAETTQARSSNVVVIDQGAVSTVVAQPPICYDSLVSEGREQQITSQLANRFAMFDTFTWESTFNQGTLLKYYDIPYDLCRRPFADSPNFLMLKKWTYWHFDLDFRIQVNANRFQVGQLLVAWNYDMTKDRRRAGRLYEAAQAPHAIISAPSNNVVELKIPFKYKFPYWSVDENLTTERSTVRVNIYVLNGLTVSTGVASSCHASVLLRLNNVRVSGMRRQVLGLRLEHQMFSMLVKQAEGLLRNVLADSNRDNPTNPTAHPVMIPYTSHSWSIGTNQVEHLNPLRLDPLGVTPHCEITDEMKVGFITRQFGFVGSFDWQTIDPSERLLKSYLVMPMNIPNLQVRYRSDVTQCHLSIYESTPLAVVSSLFSYWRGSIEFRFDFVASAFHTGRLAFCFVPGEKKTSSYSNSLQSYVQYFDLQTDTSFTFICPYVSNKTWCSMLGPDAVFPATEDNSEIIGKLYVYVVNPLVTIDNVSPVVKINTYIRAGVDFQLAVPSFPVLYPETLNYEYIPVDDNIMVKTSYYPVYAGNWRNWFGSRKIILRYGAVSDHISQFNPAYPNNIIFKSKDKVKVYQDAKGEKFVECQYFVRADTGDGYMYLTPFETFTVAQQYARDPSRDTYLLDFFVDGDWAWQSGQTLSPVSEPEIEAQAGDERTAAHEPCGFGIRSNLTAMVSFNEDFSDLKTLCRRYQLYFDASVRLTSKLAFGETFLMVPLNPTGVYYNFAILKPGNLVLEFVNRARAGPMAILANGFRFFRGGLRVKILFRSQDAFDVILSVAHIPNRYYGDSPSEFKAVNTLGYSPHGYAYYCQSSKVNECMELEIPYYLNTDFGILSDSAKLWADSDKLHSTLGNLAFSLMSRVESANTLDLGIQIFVAFADDMRFSSFQGFSGVCSTLQIPNRTPRAALTGVKTHNSIKLSQSSDDFDFLEIEHQFNPLGNIKQDIAEGITEGVNAAASTIHDSITSSFSKVSDTVMDKVSYVLEKLRDILGAAFSGIRQLMGTIVSNLIHVITNPNRITLLTAVFTITYAIFPFLTPVMSGLWKVYSSYLRWSVSKVDSLQKVLYPGAEINPYTEEQKQFWPWAGQIDEAGIEPQMGPLSSSEVANLGKQYLTLIASCLGFKMTRMKGNVPNFLGYIMINLPRLKQSVQGLVEFFQANIQMVYASIDWVTRKLSGVGIDHYIYSYPDELKEFCANANLLLNPLNLQRIRTEPVLQRTVFRMATRAQQILVSESSNVSSSRLSLHIRDLCTKLTQLQENLVNDCLSPMVKYDPFVLQINGPPGIGKSELCQSLCLKLLDAIQYKSFSEPMFTRTSGTQYWNGVNTQPCVYYDDFLFADAGDLATSCISEFMQLKSCATFNPSIAELENKKFRYSPLIVMLATNQAFWNVTFIKNRNALHRRRDRLFEVRLKQGWTMEKVKAEFAKTGKKTYDHLEFALYANVLDENQNPERFVDYETFEHEVTSFFRQYHTSQLKLYKARLAELDAHIPHIPGLAFDEGVEREVLRWLAERECANNDLVTEEWRKRVREDCSTANTTLNGRDPGISELLSSLTDSVSTVKDSVRMSEITPEVGDLQPILNCDDPQLQFLDASDREDTPHDWRCVHHEELTLSHCYVYIEDEGKAIYHIIGGTPFDEVPDDCPSNCWLTHDSSLRFRLAYVEKYYQELTLVELSEEERNRQLPPWARPMFTPSLKTDIEKAVADEPRRKRYLARLSGFSWSSCMEKAKTILKWFGVLASVMLSAFGAFSFIRDMIGLARGSSGEDVEPTTVDPWHIDHHYAPSGDVRVARKGLPKNWQKQAKIRANVLKLKFARPEYNDIDPLTSFQALLQKSCFEALLEVDGQDRFGQKGFGLCGRIAIITKHFIEKFQYLEQSGQKVFFIFKRERTRLRFRYTDLKFTTLDESSLALVEFSKTMNSFRDLRHHIVSVDDLEYLSCEGRVFEVSQGSFFVHPVVFSTEESIDIMAAENISAQTLQMCYSYSFGGRGKCGSVLFVLKPTPKIIGFHVAGISERNFGYSQAVFKEMFDGLTVAPIAEPATEHQAKEIEPKIELPPNTQFVGCLSPESCPSQPRHSQIVRSLMFDEVFPHVTEPAVLSVYDRRVEIDPNVDPLVKAIQTHGKVPLTFHRGVLQECVDDLTDYLIATTKPILAFKKELLSDQVIFGGLPTGEGFKKLNLQSSEGFPLSLFRQYNTEECNYYLQDKRAKNQGKSGKNWLFKYSTTEKGVVLEEIHPELQSLIDHNHKLRLNGEIPATIFVDTLKDSRVLPEKIKMGKTRMFSISPVEFTWAIRKYFGVFQAAYQYARIDNGTAIGINVNSLEWTHLARSLLAKGNNFVVGDYKAFGDTLQRDVMEGAFSAIFIWYEHYFDSVANDYRKVLMEELFNVTHLATNVMYKMYCGIPSGFGLTVEINDLVNQLYMRYCWKMCTKASMADYHHFVKTVTYGDDLIMSVNDEFKDRFNFKAIQKCLAEYEIDFQPAAKDGSVYETLPITEVTFLKSKFVIHPFRRTLFLAQLPLESALDTLNWQMKGNDKISVVFENSRAALNNLYGHGPKVYNEWRHKLIVWFGDAAKLGILPKRDCFVHLKTWREMDGEIFGN